MPHIDLPAGKPGIWGPMAFRPETAGPLHDLAEVLLRGDSTLSRGERELIATAVSAGNDCFFCTTAHGTFAALQLDGGQDLVDQIVADPESADISPKLRSLVAVALKVRQGGQAVTGADVDAARAQGATDIEIHDTVLIAAAFCMFNRYVDGLATWAPTDRAPYQEAGRRITTTGYAAREETRW